MKRSLFFVLLFFVQFLTQAQESTDKMKWWTEAKFGMFIHWGVYSVPAGIYQGKDASNIGEWILCKGRIPLNVYREYAKEFNTVKYNPESWVKLAQEAGMKYMVLTAKHHDGFAMFDTKSSNWDIVDATPYKKDVVKGLADACKKNNMHLGLYYSQAQDWMHPGGAYYGTAWDSLQKGNMDEYLDKIAVPQVNEILTNYGKIDILWWDTPRNMTEERAKKFDPILNKYPNLIVNNRLVNSRKGDIQTPEQIVPATGFPGLNWETCMTMNDTWGYKKNDHNWKSSKEIIEKLIEIVSKGGNFLLNVGPNEKGEIPQPSIDRLKDVGRWMKVYGNAIYGTTANPFAYLSWGAATRKGNTLYLFVKQWNNTIKVPIQNKVSNCYLVSNPAQKIAFTSEQNRVVLSLPETTKDTIATVIALEIVDEPKVFALPTQNKTMLVSSLSLDTLSKISNLNDGQPNTYWKAQKDMRTATIEVDLLESIEIASFSIAEPWHPWDNKSQNIKLFCKSGNDWKFIKEFTTKGSGYTVNIDPIWGQNFKLEITNKDTEPSISEFLLYRAE